MPKALAGEMRYQSTYALRLLRGVLVELIPTNAIVLIVKELRRYGGHRASERVFPNAPNRAPVNKRIQNVEFVPVDVEI